MPHDLMTWALPVAQYCGWMWMKCKINYLVYWDLTMKNRVSGSRQTAMNCGLGDLIGQKEACACSLL